MPQITQKFVDGLPTGKKSGDSEIPVGAITWCSKDARFGLRRGQRAHSYIAAFEWKGVSQSLSIGKTTYMDVAEAKAEHKQILAALARGQDPRNGWRRDRNKDKPTGQTWDEAATEFVEKQQPKRKPRTIQDYEKYLLRSGVIDGDIRTNKITREMIGQWVTAYGEKHSDLVTRQWLQNVSSFVNWMAAYSKVDPSLHGACAPILATYDKPKPRDRILSREEIRILWAATRPDTGADTIMAPVLRLLLLTGCRLTEITELRTDELKLNDELDFAPSHIQLKGARVKNGETHLVYLSAPARKVLVPGDKKVEWVGEYVFGPNGYHGQSKGMQAVRAKMNDILDRTKNKKLRDKVLERWEVQGQWKPHDLRRTCYTALSNELLISQRIIDLMHNHARKGMARHYIGEGSTETELHRKAQIAWDRWGEYVMDIVGEE